MLGERTMGNSLRALLGGILIVCVCSAFALEKTPQLEDCAAIPDNHDRLACFDQLAANGRARNNAELPQGVQQSPPESQGTGVYLREGKEKASILADHWELGPENKRGVFTFRPHRDNYFIATYNPSPNSAPYRPFRALVPGAGDLSRKELAYQIGFKLKLIENAMNKPVDLWFGYTQHSFWQASNRQASSPFRETNYQPELMAVVPVNFELLGLRARFVNFGLVHQSNGQASTLSRSWNRLYAQVGLQRGDFILLARIWKRINESTREDDNPDIINYMGRGDLEGTYRWNGHEFSLLTRYNFHTEKGAAQLSWAFPIASNLKGYVQFFSGYGQSLIDYNYSQRTVGLGILVSY
jgi:phospholipase A1